MKTCDDCAYAQWRRTKAGRLHPNKDGKCKYPWASPALPNSAPALMHRDKSPPEGWYIWRGHEFQDRCPYWARKEAGK